MTLIATVEVLIEEHKEGENKVVGRTTQNKLTFIDVPDNEFFLAQA